MHTTQAALLCEHLAAYCLIDVLCAGICLTRVGVTLAVLATALGATGATVLLSMLCFSEKIVEDPVEAVRRRILLSNACVSLRAVRVLQCNAFLSTPLQTQRRVLA